jgi:hypothetical protein
VLTPEKAKDPTFLDTLTSSQPDLCITAAYGQFLPTAFLAIPKLGTLNIHPSLLPRWRGASPVQRTLQAGDAGVFCFVFVFPPFRQTREKGWSEGACGCGGVSKSSSISNPNQITP